MSLIVKSFRIEKEIWDALVSEKQSSSRLIPYFLQTSAIFAKSNTIFPYLVFICTSAPDLSNKLTTSKYSLLTAVNNTVLPNSSLAFTFFPASI